MLAASLPLLGMAAYVHAQQAWDWNMPAYNKPHPIFWRASVDHVDVLVKGQALRWKDGDCSDDHATGSCITRIYIMPVDAGDVELACDYRYEMEAGYRTRSQLDADYETIPTHAPYIQHWPILFKDETTHRSIASLWSAQPEGHVYAHYGIVYDSQGNILKKHPGRIPDQRTCDLTHYSDCYWDVDPRQVQVVKTTWHPTPGDHVLRCKVYPPNGPGWFDSPHPVNRIKVHVPYPPKQKAQMKTVRSLHPVFQAQSGKAAKTSPSTFMRSGMSLSAHRSKRIALAKPRLKIRAASASLTHTCGAKQLVRVKFTVVNEGVSMASRGSGESFIQAQDSGFGSLQAAHVALPALARGQSWSHTLVMGTRTSLAKLPGMHQLVLTTGPGNANPAQLPFVPSAPFHVSLNVPGGYCQVSRPALSPVKIQRRH